MKKQEYVSSIIGFTTMLEEQLAKKASKEKIDHNNVIYMPTYSFAILALENNDANSVIRVINAIRKRYKFKFNFTKDASGFLDSVEGKAYGYLAINAKNNVDQKKFYDLAIKCFNSAKNKGYIDGYLDLAYLEKEMGNPDKGEQIAFNVYRNSDLIHLTRGEMYYGIDKLVNNAIRVIEGKRPIISVEDYGFFEYSMNCYKKGMEKSISCKFYYGLALIIYKNGYHKRKGLTIIKETYEEFKKEREKFNKTLFNSDSKIYDDNLKLIEEKILKHKNR